MKTKFLLFTILACVFYLGTPQSSEAQLGGLIDKMKKKKKKKKGGTVETPKVENPIKEVATPTVKLTKEQIEESEVIATQLYEFTRPVDINTFGLNNYVNARTAAEKLDKLNKLLESRYGNNGAKKYVEANEEAIKLYISIAEKKTKMDNSYNEFLSVSNDWKGYPYGIKNYNSLKENNWKVYTTEEVEKVWTKEDGDIGSFNNNPGLKVQTDKYFIEIAYKEKDSDKLNVIKMLRNLSKTYSLYKSMLPSTSSVMPEVEKWEKEVQKTLTDIGGAELANLYVNDFHKANVGKVFFSKSPINGKTANASTFTNEFTINDEIYAIAYFDATLKDLKLIEGTPPKFNPYANVNVDGYSSDFDFVIGDWSKMANQGYLTFAIKPSTDKADNVGAIKYFAKTISEKSPRSHSIPVKVQSAATGSFSISLSGMDKTKIQADAEKAIKVAKSKLEQAKVLARGLPKQFSNPNLYSHSFQPVSFAQVKALIQRNLVAGYGAAKVDAIVVQNENSKNKSNWEVKVNAFGTPLSRSGPGYYVAYTGKDGKCYHYYFYIFQKYQGGGYGPTTNGTPNGITPTEYNCAKKKFAK